tara:strand:- start:517 stop:726 length:210 start_codon:yes stop_codon:yes gene_type:complete
MDIEVPQYLFLYPAQDLDQVAMFPKEMITSFHSLLQEFSTAPLDSSIFVHSALSRLEVMYYIVQNEGND